MIVSRTVPDGDAARIRVFVPTMGALHDGHRALIRAARERAGGNGEVIVSVFVNPTQFGPGEDFDAYPRTIEADERACREEGVDVLYLPKIEDIYPSGEPNSQSATRITVDPGSLGRELEGATRPGHFGGVLTVVSILLHRVAPQVAIFGEKDYQQLQLIRRMCVDLGMSTHIVGVETVRDSDGLALSSRNVYLDTDQRTHAAAIPRALEAARMAAPNGADASRQAAIDVLESVGMEIDYVEVRSIDLGTAPDSGPARLLVACMLGNTRLIDNCALELGK